MNDARRKEIDAMIELGVGEPWRAAAVDLREALREAEASVADMCRGREHLTQQLGVLRVRAERAEAGLCKIQAQLDGIRTACGDYADARIAVADTLRYRKEAEAQLAALREATLHVRYGIDPDESGGGWRDLCATLDAALTDTAQAAEAYTRRVRAEALREAAEACDREAADCSTATGSYIASRCGTLLRTRADEIERGPQEPESPVYDPGPRVFLSEKGR